MEVIIREINKACDTIEKGKKGGYDGAPFAEEHVHSVQDIMSNKDMCQALSEFKTSLSSSYASDSLKDDFYTVLRGSDISENDLIVNKQAVGSLIDAISKCHENKEKFTFVLQYGVNGNEQMDTMKIAAGKLQYPYIVVHREDWIARFSKECEPNVRSAFAKAKELHSKTQSPVILYVSDLDGVIANNKASPSEQLKRKTVEKVLCDELSKLSVQDEIIVVMSSESPFALKNELQTLQGAFVFYRVPTQEERATCIQQFLSIYDNSLSDHLLQHLILHSSAFSLIQIQTIFHTAFWTMLLCCYNAIPAESCSDADFSKAAQYAGIVQYVNSRQAGPAPVVPSIPDHVILSILANQKLAFSVVDVSRVLEWVRSQDPQPDVISELEGMIKLLRERDDFLRREDSKNTASFDLVERRSGAQYSLPTLPQTTTDETPSSETPATPTSPSSAMQSGRFGRVLSAEVLNTNPSDFRRQLEADREAEAARLKEKEQRNLQERARLRAEEENRARAEAERRAHEFEAMKEKEAARQRKIEEKLAAEEAKRNKKLEEERRAREESARLRAEEKERREEERRQREMEEFARREQERVLAAEKRRQREEAEIRKKEAQNQREAAEQMKRFEEERRRVYEQSMGFDGARYQKQAARLDSQKSQAQLELEKSQKQRDEAVKKARAAAMERLAMEKAQRQMEDEVYKKLAEARRPAPVDEEEKKKRVQMGKEAIAANLKRLQELRKKAEEVKAIVEARRKKEEEERKRKEEEERKKREEEERKLAEERKRKEEEERKKKEEEAERRRIEAEKRKAELEKEKEEIRQQKAAEAKKMQERLMQDELRLFDCKEKMYELKKLLKEVKRGKFCVCSKNKSAYFNLKRGKQRRKALLSPLWAQQSSLHHRYQSYSSLPRR